MSEYEVDSKAPILLSYSCNQKWQEMEGDESKRACELCQCKVQNIDGYSEIQIAQLLEQVDQGQKICVAFTKAAFRSNIPQALRKNRTDAALQALHENWSDISFNFVPNSQDTGVQLPSIFSVTAIKTSVSLLLATSVGITNSAKGSACLLYTSSGKSIRSCCLGLQPIQQLALFSYLLFNIMPLVEVVKSFLGVSSFQPDLMPYFMLWGAAYALVPLIAFTLIGDSRRSLALLNIRPTGMKSMLSNNFSLNNRGHHQVLNNREFSLDLLEGKSDADVITLIDIAKSSGHFEKAEQMSKYLLERQA